MDGKLEVFLDTSVLFVAVLSDTGGSRALLKLGEVGVIALYASRQVLKEAEGVLKRKAPDALPLLILLLDRAGIQVTSSAPDNVVNQVVKLAGHPGDAQIAADALATDVDYLVTLDKTHLLGNRELQEKLPFPIGTPGDFLILFKRKLGAGC